MSHPTIINDINIGKLAQNVQRLIKVYSNPVLTLAKINDRMQYSLDYSQQRAAADDEYCTGVDQGM